MADDGDRAVNVMAQQFAEFRAEQRDHHMENRADLREISATVSRLAEKVGQVDQQSKSNATNIAKVSTDLQEVVPQIRGIIAFRRQLVLIIFGIVSAVGFIFHFLGPIVDLLHEGMAHYQP